MSDHQSVTPSGPPCCDPLAFAYWDKGSYAFRTFNYVTRTHTWQDVCRMGYFDNVAASYMLRPWDEIHVVVGDDPATAVNAILRVARVPGTIKRTGSEMQKYPGWMDAKNLEFVQIGGLVPKAVQHNLGIVEAETKSKTKAA